MKKVVCEGVELVSGVFLLILMVFLGYYRPFKMAVVPVTLFGVKKREHSSFCVNNLFLTH